MVVLSILRKKVEELLWQRAGNPQRIHGKVFGAKCTRNAFEKKRRKLGMKHLRIYDFHHSAAANMRKAKTDTTAVMKICGWKSVQMLLRNNEVDDSDLQKASLSIA